MSNSQSQQANRGWASNQNKNIQERAFREPVVPPDRIEDRIQSPFYVAYIIIFSICIQERIECHD